MLFKAPNNLGGKVIDVPNPNFGGTCLRVLEWLLTPVILLMYGTFNCSSSV